MHILLATDGSPDGNAGCELLRQYQARPDDRVTIVVVTPARRPGADLRPPESLASLSPAEAIATETAHQLEEAGYQVAWELPHGDPAAEIRQLAESTGADLIVLGKQGVGALRRLLLGSVAVNVSRHATCPVLLMTDPASFSRILVVSDNSPETARAARIVQAMPVESIDHVTFLEINRTGAAGDAIAEAFHQAAVKLEESGVDVELAAAAGNEVDVVLERAEVDQATLIVAAAADVLVGDEPLLGTTVHGLIDRAPCSLLIAR